VSAGFRSGMWSFRGALGSFFAVGFFQQYAQLLRRCSHGGLILFVLVAIGFVAYDRFLVPRIDLYERATLLIGEKVSTSPV